MKAPRLLQLPGALHALRLQPAGLAGQQPLVRLGGLLRGLARQALRVAHLAAQLLVGYAPRRNRRPARELGEPRARAALTLPAQVRLGAVGTCADGCSCKQARVLERARTHRLRPDGPAAPASCAGCAGRGNSSSAITCSASGKRLAKHLMQNGKKNSRLPKYKLTCFGWCTVEGLLLHQ